MAQKIEKKQQQQKKTATDYLLPLLLVLGFFLSDMIWRVYILVHIDTNF